MHAIPHQKKAMRLSEVCKTFAIYSRLMTKFAFGIYEHNKTQGTESKNSAAHTYTHKNKIGVICGSQETCSSDGPTKEG